MVDETTFLPEEKYSTNPQLYIVSTDGANIRKISEDDLFPVGSAPFWTPDGQLLLGSTASGLNIYPLVMLNLENSKRKVISENVPSYYFLSFLNPQEEESLAEIISEPFAFTCATGWTHLELGKDAIVAPGGPNQVRADPMKGDNLIVQIPAGTVVRFTDGSVCADGLVFWKVEGESIPGGPGWTAEGDGVEFWLEPDIPD
jgi:hypothetical protein